MEICVFNGRLLTVNNVCGSGAHTLWRCFWGDDEFYIKTEKGKKPEIKQNKNNVPKIVLERALKAISEREYIGDWRLEMTENEAIEVIKSNFPKTRKNADDTDSDFGKALTLSISALEEIQKYREFKSIFEEHMSDIAVNLLSDKTEFTRWLCRIHWTTKRLDEIGRELEELREVMKGKE